MIKDTKKLSARAFAIIALYSLFTYLIAHLAYLNMNTDIGIIYETASLYLGKITGVLLPTLIATPVLMIYLTDGAKKALRVAVIAASARVVYTLPYYYIIFIYNYGYDSIEAITLSAIASIATVGFTVIGVFAALWIALIIIRRLSKCDNVKATLTESLISRQHPGDFLCGINLALLIFALFSFACSLVPEIVDTVSYLIEYKLDYTAIEIITIMFNYVLLFALIIISYLTAVFLKNKLISDEPKS